MYRVKYQNGKNNNEWEEKTFKTFNEVLGFKIVSWYEYHCYNFKIEKIEKEG